MPDWSIEIVEREVEGTKITSFDPPDLPAMQDDLVSWNNTTGQAHRPWLLDADGNLVPDPSKPDDPKSRLVPTYMSDLVPAQASSRPAFNVVQPSSKPATWKISYGCKEHPDILTERGTITGHIPGTGTTS